MANIKTETITRFQFRRGSTQTREGIVFQPGEPAWDSDQNTLYMGVPSVSGGQLCINLNSIEFDTSNIAANGVSIDYQGFTSNFSQYITNNPSDPSVQTFNNTVTRSVTSVIASDPSLGESILFPATTDTLGGVIVGDGLSVTNEGRVSLKLGPGVGQDPDGSIIIDTSSAAKNWLMYVNNNLPLSADDLSTQRPTIVSNPGPVAVTVVTTNFASVIGAYLYGLRYLPPNCNLDIVIWDGAMDTDTETYWNHPIEGSFIQSVSSTIYQAGSASEDEQWNIQLAFPAPQTDNLFKRYDRLRIYTGGCHPELLHRLVVSVDTSSYKSIYNTLNIPIKSVMNPSNPGWSSPGILFWFADNGSRNVINGVIPTIEYDGDANDTASIIRFDASKYELIHSGVEVRGSNTPYIERVFEGFEQSHVYIIGSLYVSLTGYDSSKELFQGFGPTLPGFEFYTAADRPDQKFIYKTSDIPLLSGWYHYHTITTQLAWLSSGRSADLGIYSGELEWNFPGIRMVGDVTFKSIHDTLTANNTYFTNNPLSVTTVNKLGGCSSYTIDQAVSGAGYYIESPSSSAPSPSPSIPSGAPVITADPVNVTVSSTSTATVIFAINAAGAEPLSYLWQTQPPSGSWIDLADTSVFSGTHTSQMYISNTSGHNGYQYRCVVSNSYGSVTSNAATLTLT